MYLLVIEPVTKDHLSWQTFFMPNGVVFEDGFYYSTQKISSEWKLAGVSVQT